MKKIQMEFNYLSEAKEAGVVKVAGEIDLTTISEFSEFMNKVTEIACNILLFDLGQLRYMNSTGFGIFASLAMDESEKGIKRIAFFNMQKTVQATYNLMGFENIAPNFATLEQALEHLRNKQAAPQEDKETAKPPAPQARPEEPKPPLPKQEEKATFPLIRSCTNCQKPCNFLKPGHYKCPYCNTIHQLDEKGSLTQLSLPKKKPQENKQDAATDEIDISLPSDAIHLSRIRDFVFSFFMGMFSDQERADMAMAVDEACENAIEHAHNSERGKKLYIHLEVNPQKVSLTIKDSGENTFKNVVQSDKVNQDQLKRTGRGMGLFLIKQVMDEVQIKPTEKWGTSLTMTKYIKKKEEQPGGVAT